MATFSKELLSGTPADGRNIKIVATATPGTLIHTADATAKDEIWLWVTNTDSALQKITLEFGGVLVPDDIVEYTVPAEDGPFLIVPGWILTNSLVLRAFIAVTNLVNVNGYVNRIT